nr:MAG TPA: Putative ATP dependent Clp protease [Caudoviricetes sp.]
MEQKNVVYRFQKADNVHEIFIFDEIRKNGPFNWDTWRYEDSETSAKHFRELLNEIPENEEIKVYFNSNGGSVDQGTTIYNMLRQHGSYKTGIVMGGCHSIAFTILQACDKRIMGQGTTAIIHDMWETVTGNAADLRAEADNLDVAMDSCVALFMQRATISEDELRDLMHKTTTLSPQMALEYGLIDEIGVVQKEEDQGVKLQEVLRENEMLQMQLKNRNEHQKQLAEFYQVTHKKEEKKEEKDSTGWGAFFN